MEYNELAQRWKRLHQGSGSDDFLPPPDDHRVEFHHRAQNMSDVAAVVRAAQSLWRSSPRHHLFHASVALADEFLISVDYHCTLLETIWEHDIYISLFCGVLQSLIKVYF